MHKRLVNHCTIELSLTPLGPILIKAGKQGADPTKPDMEFVETYHAGERTIYLPGSSLKGALRAHTERIVRTVGHTEPGRGIWANDPIKDKRELKGTGPEIYSASSFTEQMFGNTSLAGRVRIEDAYPTDPAELRLEERNGVAIDRVFGSVAVGPFNYQVCTEGEFRTRIHLKNFTLPQLGLMGLVLRDLNDGWFGIGFAKSRGMGQMEVTYERTTVQYPGCVLQEGRIQALGAGRGEQHWPDNTLLGAGMFLSDGTECKAYGFPEQDTTEVEVRAEAMKLGFGVRLTWQGKEQVQDLFIQAVKRWKTLVQPETVR